MGNMSSSGYQTPTEAPIVEESVNNQPLVDGTNVKAETENLENPEEILEAPENMHGDEISLGERDFNFVREQEILASPTGDPNIVKAEGTLESQQGDSDTYKSEEAIENSTVDSDDVKVESFEKPEGDSDSIKADEAPKKPEGGLILQEHDKDNVLYLFMKEGGCKDSYVAWKRCIDADKSGEKDVLLKCFDATEALVKCMKAHIEYYRPVLGAEAEGSTEPEKEYDHEEHVQTKAAAYEELKKEKGNEDVQASKKEDD